jgi:hypothetical protein
LTVACFARSIDNHVAKKSPSNLVLLSTAI